MHMKVEDLLRAKAILEANDQEEPRPMPFTRREAEAWFGADAVRNVPDRVVTRVCGQEIFIVGDRWPDLTRRT